MSDSDSDSRRCRTADIQWPQWEPVFERLFLNHLVPADVIRSHPSWTAEGTVCKKLNLSTVTVAAKFSEDLHSFSVVFTVDMKAFIKVKQDKLEVWLWTLLRCN